MADFTIKPASGTGNKLILQTQAETDVLTTSDSGVTLASATLTAPTITEPTITTPTITTPTITGDTTNNGNIIMATNKKVQQKGAFMQSSTHQAWVMGG